MSRRECRPRPGFAGQPLAGNEPVFAEPWEAQVFAMTVSLHEAGHFTWSEWAEMLGATIAADRNDTPYYELWTRALETLLEYKSLVSSGERRERSQAWRSALARTPHGQPVMLEDEKAKC